MLPLVPVPLISTLMSCIQLKINCSRRNCTTLLKDTLNTVKGTSHGDFSLGPIEVNLNSCTLPIDDSKSGQKKTPERVPLPVDIEGS